MAISTVTVDFSAILQNAATATGLLRVRLSQVGTVEDSETGNEVILPITWQETTLTDGAATLALVPNKIIEPSCTYYEIQLKSVPDCPKACAKLLLSGIMYVPDEDCNVLDLLISPPSPETANTASGYASQAKQAAQVAEYFAVQAGDRYDDVAEAAATALTDIGTAKQDALDSIGTAQSGATEAISTAEDAALQAIGQARGAALDDIGTARGTAIADIESASSNALTAISTAQGTATAAVQAEGNTQVGRVEDAGEDAVADVAAAQATAVSAVQAQQATSVAAVTAEGTRQTGFVTAEGTAQVNAVTQAGNGYVSTMQGLVSDAQAARDAAQTAQGLAEDAQAAAESASTDAQGFAGDASTSAGQAAQSASDAATSATAAQASAESIAASAAQIQTNERNITNIQALLNGTLYREETDSTAAYSKAIPTGALPWASIDEIGGRTVAWNQLFNETNVAGIYTSISHNSETHSYDITVSETSSTTYCGLLYNYSGSNLKGHKILNVVTLSNPNFANTPLGVQFMQRGESQNTGSITINYHGAGVYSGISDVSVNATYIYCYMKFNSITANDSFTFSKWQIFDLTAMFGAGNEPATVAEFEAIFPAEYYAYDAGTLKSAAVTQVVSEGKNLFDITTLDGISGLTINGNEFSIIYSLNLFSKNIFVNTGKRTGPMTITGEMFYHSANLVGLVVNVQYTDNSTVSSIVTERNQWGAIPTITTDPAKVVKRVFFSYASSNVQTDVRNLQVEWGASATAYAPYRAPIFYPVPAAIQALPGYGWSAGNVYNYVDYERKVYVQRVGSVDLGSLTWNKANTSSGHWWFGVTYSDVTVAPTGSTKPNMVCSRYLAITPNDSYTGVVGVTNNINSGALYVCDESYTDATSFKAAMQGVMLYYELATPVETDISQYLSDDNLINVEAGGTLTFKNQNGDDFRLPVPNEETFLVQATPELPSADGTYTLQCTVTGGTPSVTWVTA